jgi:hypothetical protein
MRGSIVPDSNREDHMNISVVLRVLALICFVLAALGVPLGPVALVPLGLACWVGSTLG